MQRGGLSLTLLCSHCHSRSLWFLTVTPRGFPTQVVCQQRFAKKSLCCQHGNPLAKPRGTITYFPCPSQSVQESVGGEQNPESQSSSHPALSVPYCTFTLLSHPVAVQSYPVGLCAPTFPDREWNPSSSTFSFLHGLLNLLEFLPGR